jgi:hypothetical protein
MTKPKSKYEQIASQLAAKQLAALDEEPARIDVQIRMLQDRKGGIALLRARIAPLAQEEREARPPTADAGYITIVPGTGALAISGDPGNAHSTGFSAAVRAILGRYPKGLRPKEVVREMQQNGNASLYAGKAPFNVRVGNELYRLMKNKTLVRRSGRYFVANGSATVEA